MKIPLIPPDQEVIDAAHAQAHEAMKLQAREAFLRAQTEGNIEKTDVFTKLIEELNKTIP